MGGSNQFDYRGIGESIHDIGTLHLQRQQQAIQDAHESMMLAQQTGDPDAIQQAAQKYESAKRVFNPGFSLPTRTIPGVAATEAVTSTARGPMSGYGGEEDVLHGPGKTPTTREIAPATPGTPSKTEYAIPATGLDTLMHQRSLYEHAISSALTDEGRNLAIQNAAQWRKVMISRYPQWEAMIPDYETQAKDYVSRQAAGVAAKSKEQWLVEHRNTRTRFQAALRGQDLTELENSIDEHNASIQAGRDANYTTTEGQLDPAALVKKWATDGHLKPEVLYQIQDDLRQRGVEVSPAQQRMMDTMFGRRTKLANSRNAPGVEDTEVPSLQRVTDPYTGGTKGYIYKGRQMDGASFDKMLTDMLDNQNPDAQAIIEGVPEFKARANEFRSHSIGGTIPSDVPALEAELKRVTMARLNPETNAAQGAVLQRREKAIQDAIAAIRNKNKATLEQRGQLTSQHPDQSNTQQKRLTMAQIAAGAKANNMTIEQAIADAEKQGFVITDKPKP